MDLNTTRTRAAAIAMGAALLVTMAGCSSGGSNSPKMPVQIDTPKALSSDLHFAVGRDDDFITSNAKSQGAHGAVIVVENTSDDDVKIGPTVNLGPKAAWGSFGNGVASDYKVDSGKLPKGCSVNGFTANGADFASSSSSSYTVKAHETAVACTVLTPDAAPKDGALQVTITASSDDNGDEQAVKVGNLFSK
jgi:hypothetical protein